MKTIFSARIAAALLGCAARANAAATTLGTITNYSKLSAMSWP